MLIDGFGIAGYRSFGPELQKIGPCTKVNMLVGQNNSGKSNILLFLRDQFGLILTSLRNSKSFQYDLLDQHIGGNQRAQAAVFLSFDNDKLSQILQKVDVGTRNIASRVLRSQALTHGDNGAWFKLSQELREAITVDPIQVEEVKLESGCSYDEWQTLSAQVTGEDGGSLEYWVESTIAYFARLAYTGFKTSIIPAIRRVATGVRRGRS